MKIITKTYYINIYVTELGSEHCSDVFTSIDDALENMIEFHGALHTYVNTATTNGQIVKFTQADVDHHNELKNFDRLESQIRQFSYDHR